MLEWSERPRPLFKLQKDCPSSSTLHPRGGADAFHTLVREAIGHYPIWLVPYRMPERYPWLRADHFTSDRYIDFAIYGLPNDQRGDELLGDARAEDVRGGGIKTLISENHYDERTFWKVYDRERYERVKRRTDPANLPQRLREAQPLLAALTVESSRAPNDATHLAVELPRPLNPSRGVSSSSSEGARRRYSLSTNNPAATSLLTMPRASTSRGSIS